MGLQDDNLAIVELTARYNQVIDGGFADPTPKHGGFFDDQDFQLRPLTKQ